MVWEAIPPPRLGQYILQDAHFATKHFVIEYRGELMKINFKKLDARAVVPMYGTDYSAGADLRAILDAPIVIEPDETVFLRTGLAVAIPTGYVGLIYARSGIACKRGLAPANKTGVVDSDFRGEIMVALHNHGTVAQTVEPNERIAQMVVAPFVRCEYEETDDLDVTERGTGGFGSTGLQ